MEFTFSYLPLTISGLPSYYNRSTGFKTENSYNFPHPLRVKKMKLISVEERGKSELKEISGNKAIKRLGLFLGDRLKIMRVCNSTNSSATSKTGILFDQILDSSLLRAYQAFQRIFMLGKMRLGRQPLCHFC
jgi:hypothetical protein